MDRSRPPAARHWAFLVLLVVAFLALDQVTKAAVVRWLDVGEAWAPIPTLAGAFTITHVQNTGVAFGQLRDLGWAFMLVNLAVLVGVVVYYPRIRADQPELRWGAALIAAGDLGNLIDRVRHAVEYSQVSGSLWSAFPRAYVTDFVDVKIWPVWNVADMCVVAGVILIAWNLWRAERAAAIAKARALPLPNDPGQPATGD